MQSHPLRLKLEAQRKSFASRGSPGYDERVRSLNALFRSVLARRDDLVRAISEDFGGRAREETLLFEVVPLLQEIRHTRRHLRRWMRSRRVAADWVFLPGKAGIVYQPLGIVGIIGAWNYPMLLTLSPLVGALAAGNHAMLKPSELVPRTGELLAEIVSAAFAEDHVCVVNGGPEVAASFSTLPFDHLLFTGSARVGRSVMRAASENLTPVTLELGGKSPVLIHASYPLRRAAERILAGKLYNAGQTCLAPDYVLVPESAESEFVSIAREIIANMYPRLVENPSYTRIIDRRHYERLGGLLDDAQNHSAEVIEVNPAGERCTSENRVMAPALLRRLTEGMSIMREEIFGPVLPIVPYRTLDEAIAYISGKPRPLAVYYFDEDRRRVNRVLTETTSGGVTVNDVLFHIAQKNLPFGGVGPSGMGHYHGFDGFETFSKKKAVFRQSRFSSAAMLRPPYGRRVECMIRFFIGR